MTYLFDSLDAFPDSAHLGRTLVKYDRFGVTLQSWRENDCDEETEPFEYRERWMNWKTVRSEARRYATGTLKARIVQAMQTFIGEYSHYSGFVPDVQTVIDEYGNQKHW